MRQLSPAEITAKARTLLAIARQAYQVGGVKSMKTERDAQLQRLATVYSQATADKIYQRAQELRAQELAA